MSPGTTSLVGVGSFLMERPYLSVCRKNQQKKKPQKSKLSILSKTSMCSTKVNSNECKKRGNSKDTKRTESIADPSRKKTRSNSCKQRLNKTIKV